MNTHIRYKWWVYALFRWLSLCGVTIELFSSLIFKIFNKVRKCKAQWSCNKIRTPKNTYRVPYHNHVSYSIILSNIYYFFRSARPRVWKSLAQRDLISQKRLPNIQKNKDDLYGAKKTTNVCWYMMYIKVYYTPE